MHCCSSRETIPGIATHDPAIIADAKRFVAEQGIDRSRSIPDVVWHSPRPAGTVGEGRLPHAVYVPFGGQWYPYLMRRLAERPANVAFITGNVVREMIGGRKA
jgi:proline dehydrogenase